MVRLKGIFYGIFEFLNILFQFQNGAIKRLQVKQPYSMHSQFQFQNGAIKSLTLKLESSTTDSFQFQNGAIKRLYWLM